MNLIGSIVGNPIGLGLLSVRTQRGFTAEDGTDFFPDVTLEETHMDEVVPTDHPVERGAMISDHAIVMPAELSMVVGWSNSRPLIDQSARAATNNILTASAIGQLIPASNTLYNTALTKSPLLQKIATAAAIGDIAQNVNDVLNGTYSTQQYVDKVYKKLLRLKDARELFEIMTGRRIYKNMLLTGLQVTTEARTENSMVVRMTFREMLLATTSVQQIETGIAPDAKPDGVSVFPVNRGTVTVRQLTDAKAPTYF